MLGGLAAPSGCCVMRTLTLTALLAAGLLRLDAVSLLGSGRFWGSLEMRVADSGDREGCKAADLPCALCLFAFHTFTCTPPHALAVHMCSTHHTWSKVRVLALVGGRGGGVYSCTAPFLLAPVCGGFVAGVLGSLLWWSLPTSPKVQQHPALAAKCRSGRGTLLCQVTPKRLTLPPKSSSST